jgi:hypothetical protein
MDTSWFAILLASITAALLVFSEDSVAQPTPPCSGSLAGVEPDGAVITPASYKAYESTPLAKSSTSAHSPVPSRAVNSSHSVGLSSGQCGLRNGTHPCGPGVTASVRAEPSAMISSTGVAVKDRSTSVRVTATPTVASVSPSSGTSPSNSTLFTGAGAQNLVMSAMVGGVVLLSFLWFL